ncbi:Ig-like domain-containing protein, partial [Capnocytophaga cynodegmi]
MRKVFNYMDMRGLYFLFLVCSLFGFGELKAQNPQLKSQEDAPPQPSVCGVAETYTVTIQTGNVAHNDVNFRVVLPEHFEYDNSGVQVTQGGSVTNISYNSSSREITMNLNIPASSTVAQMKVSFKARVLCGGAESADVADNQRPRMGYYLGTFGSGNSQPIIVKYAVLQTSVAPQSSNLPVSGTVERTITVRNGGQGAVQSFKLVTTIDSGLEIVSSDLTGLPNGWAATQDTNAPGTYQFSGGNLAPGQSIAIKQVVKVKACSGLTSSYKASYGCTPEECTSSNINNTTAKPTITADKTPRPDIVITAVNADGSPVGTVGANGRLSNITAREGALCLDTDITHIWKIENKGSAAATDLEIIFSTPVQGIETGSTYFMQGGDSFQWDTDINFGSPQSLALSNFATWDKLGDRFNTNSQLRHLKAKLNSEISAGQTVYIRFKTRNNSFKSSVTCEEKSSRFSFGGITRELSYKNANVCSNNLNFSVASTVMQSPQSFLFEGNNVAGAMVENGQEYDGKFVFSLFHHGVGGGSIKPGDYFDVVFQLSPSFTLTPGSLKIVRVDDVNYTIQTISEANNIYRLRIKFGEAIYQGHSDRLLGEFNQPLSYLTFKATYNCGSVAGGEPAWYKMHMESNKGASCTPATVFETRCLQVDLTPTGCTSGCTTGFSRGAAKVERHPEDYGYVATSPDSRGLPKYPLEKVNASTTGINPSAFHTNDRIWVSQRGTIVATTTPINWSKGIFVVDMPTGSSHNNYLNLYAPGSSNAAIVNPNGGRLKLTRDNTLYEIENLPVTVTGNKVTLEFATNVFANKGVPTLQPNDKLEAFVEIQPNNGLHEYRGVRVFDTDFYLVDTANVEHRCGPNGKANSLYAVTRFRWIKQSPNEMRYRRLVNCDTNYPMTGDPVGNTPLAREIGVSTYFGLYIYVNELIAYNSAFPKENRQFMTPKQVVVTVPQGLDLEGFYVQLSGMGGSNYNYYRLSIPTISGTTHTIDVQDVIKKMLEARYASAQNYINGMTVPVNVDEGYWLRFTPVVKKNCYSGVQEDLEAYAVFDGTGRNVDGGQFHSNETNIQTHAQTITYFIDNDKLSATVAQPATTSNTEEVKWVVKVDNTSTFHTFQNLWLGSEDMTITSVQEASDAAGQNVIGSTFVNSGGIFQLGELSSTKRPPTRYFVVTANVPDCGTGNRNLVFGHSCTYPTSVNDACSKTEIPVSFTKTEGTLQLRILKQPLPDHAPALCELLEYDIEVNNSGRGQAKEIQVRIPLGLNSGLTFEPGRAKLSTKYTTTSVEPNIALADSNVSVTTDEIIVTIPNETLAPVEKIRLSLQLRTTSDCNFNLSNQIAFIPSGKNYCGSDLTGGTNAISNRLRYKDDVTNNPKVEVNQSSATIVFSDVSATGNPTARYSLEIINKGEGANQDVITANSAVLAIKLPMGWEFVNTSQVETSSGNKLRYQSYDAVTSTYFYQVVTNIPVNDVLGIIEAEITTQSPQSCPISGNVEAMLYYNVPGLHSVCDNAIGGFSPCAAKKTLAQATTPMTLTIPDATLNTAISTQFCNNATVADLNVLVVEKAVLAWYNSPTGGTELADNTPLTTGIYYVALRDKLVLGCESLNRTPVNITLVNCNPIVANDDMFTLVNGNTGGSIGNVLSDNGSGEDTLNNNPVTTTNVTINEVTPANSINGGSVPTLDTTTGNVTVPAGTPAGTYTIVYRICESGNPVNNCDTATVTVIVSTIEANDDDMSGSPVDGATGNPNLVNVLMNDTLNGVPNIPITEVTIIVTTQATPIGGSSNVPVLDPATGNVSVPAGTPAGAYTITYQVCTKSTICDTANVVVVVTAQPIEAKDDSFAPVVGVTGGTAGNVLSDNGNGTDTLGNVPATTTNVDITEVTPASPINGSS